MTCVKHPNATAPVCIRCQVEKQRELQRRIATLESVLRELIRRLDGAHAEDCNAYGAADVEVTEDANGSDPYCQCGATRARNDAREALKEGEAKG